MRRVPLLISTSTNIDGDAASVAARRYISRDSRRSRRLAGAKMLAPARHDALHQCLKLRCRFADA